MTEAEAGRERPQSLTFLLLYALAVSGGSIAYVPFLTMLLPLQATALTSGSAINTLAYAAFFGAIAASLCNIAFGWLSDLTGTRKPWIIAGMLASSAMLALMPYASGPLVLIAMIVGWQVFLNMMLAPLAAWAGDCVPNSQKGFLGGFLAFAPALGAISGAVITVQNGPVGVERYWVVVAFVVMFVTPVLVFGRPVAMPHLTAAGPPEAALPGFAAISRATVVHMWLARLCVQIAEASLFAFLLMWFRSLDPAFSENQAARVFSLTLILSIAAAMLIGRWSDRHQRPILPLGLSALCAAIGLGVMAVAQSLSTATVGYMVFGLAGAVFLALHTSQTLRILPSSRSRGRDLGVFNLTNTAPSLVMPWLILALVPVYGFGALFALLAALAIAACALLATMPRLQPLPRE